MKKTLAFILFFYINGLSAQFAPAAGVAGSSAIYKDSSVFKSWGTACVIEQGWQNIADTSLGKASAGDNSSVIGKAGENGTASLGDGGMATISFSSSVYNGPGYDFAVFENSFLDSFLELAFVEVSTDGSRYVRFPSTSNTQDTLQVSGFGYLEATAINNLAGKYRANFGTPFDLEELKDSTGIDINSIRYVRIVDVVGSITDSFARKDAFNHKVNDPWPTPFPSSGFDLDAVGVINSLPSSIKDLPLENAKIYPTITSDRLFIQGLLQQVVTIEMFDLCGQKINYLSPIDNNQSIDVKDFETGWYVLTIKDKSEKVSQRFYKTD